MENKCFQCGLVNWKGATECARCKSALGSAAVVGVSPYREAAEKRIDGLRIGMIMVVALLGGFVAYQFLILKVNEPDVPKVTAEDVAKKLQANRNAVEERWADNKKAIEKMMIDKATRGLPQSPTGPPYTPSGGLGPPGAGVPYTRVGPPGSRQQYVPVTK